MTAPIVVNENAVDGCYGVIEEQENEDYYDERSEADDDIEKGKIRFSQKKLYGREKELSQLMSVYQTMIETTAKQNEKKEMMKDAYYAFRGWEPSTGNPGRVKLAELGLDDV